MQETVHPGRIQGHDETNDLIHGSLIDYSWNNSSQGATGSRQRWRENPSGKRLWYRGIQDAALNETTIVHRVGAQSSLQAESAAEIAA